jgi:hypothetical protein
MNQRDRFVGRGFSRDIDEAVATGLLAPEARNHRGHSRPTPSPLPNSLRRHA